MPRLTLLRAAAAASTIAAVAALSVTSVTYSSSAAAVSEPAARASTVPKAVNGAKISTRLRAAIRALPVRAENRSGYQRTKFKHWDDVNRDCQDTRSEVLRAEAKKKVKGKCTVKTGRWVSQYDGQVRTKASQLDIDHLVPLAEAWDSGARAWTGKRREAFANDLTDPRTLIAVTATTNRSKGDSDPTEWLPAKKKCVYVVQWTTVKTRWGLSVDAAEKAALTRYAATCSDAKIVTHRAVVKMVGKKKGGGHGGGGGGGGTGGGGTDPRFGTCTEAKDHGYGPYYAGSDPEYYWYDDRDNDGIVCE